MGRSDLLINTQPRPTGLCRADSAATVATTVSPDIAAVNRQRLRRAQPFGLCHEPVTRSRRRTALFTERRVNAPQFRLARNAPTVAACTARRALRSTASGVTHRRLGDPGQIPGNPTHRSLGLIPLLAPRSRSLAAIERARGPAERRRSRDRVRVAPSAL
jgi:hypothetical protein